MRIKKVFMFLFFLFIFAFLAFSSSPNLAAHFNSNGDFIKGWYWLRDSTLNHYAEWTFEAIREL